MPQRTSYTAVLVLALTAAFFTALLSAPGLAAWADALPDSAVSRAFGAAAHGVSDFGARVGLDRPAGAIQAIVRRLEAERFSDKGN